MKKILKILITVIGILCLCNQGSIAQSNTTLNYQQVKVFKAGAFNLDRDKLVRNCDYNVSGWVDCYVKRKNRQQFYDAYQEVVNAIQEGRISRGYDRSLYDTKGILRNREEKGYDPMMQVVNFFNYIIDEMIKRDNFIK